MTLQSKGGEYFPLLLQPLVNCTNDPNLTFVNICVWEMSNWKLPPPMPQYHVCPYVGYRVVVVPEDTHN